MQKVNFMKGAKMILLGASMLAVMAGWDAPDQERAPSPPTPEIDVPASAEAAWPYSESDFTFACLSRLYGPAD